MVDLISFTEFGRKGISVPRAALRLARVTGYAYDPIYNKPTQIADLLGRITIMVDDAATDNLLTVVANAAFGTF